MIFLQWRLRLDIANCCAMPCTCECLKLRGASSSATVIVHVVSQFIGNYPCIPSVQLKCRHMPRPFLLPVRRVGFGDQSFQHDVGLFCCLVITLQKLSIGHFSPPLGQLLLGFFYIAGSQCIKAFCVCWVFFYQTP